jgi:signal transduction histidine kinase
MQGRITLISEVAHGTTVDIFIPFKISAESKPS